MRNLGISLAVLAAMVSVSSFARSESITYKIQATASGTLGGTEFDNALVTVWATGDTEDVVDGMVWDTYSLYNMSFSGSIEGLDSFNVLGIGFINIFTLPSGDPAVDTGFLDFGVWDLPNGVYGKSIFSMTSSLLAGYDLKSATAGVSGLVSTSPLDYDFSGFQTSAGRLVFTSAELSSTSLTFGVFTATTAAVPEPTGLMMLALGVGAVVILRRPSLSAIRSTNLS